MRLIIAILAGAFVVAPAMAEDLKVIDVTLKNHTFSPAEIHVPTGKPFFIVVHNEDDAADEFDMPRPAIEKVVAGHSEGKVRFPPLGPGRFPFSGEYHPETAKGVIVSE